MHGQIHVTLFSTSLLNRANLVVMWVTWVRELPGSVGAWVAWIEYFLCGSTFYVGLNFYVGQIYFCVGQNYLRGSKIFT